MGAVSQSRKNHRTFARARLGACLVLGSVAAASGCRPGAPAEAPGVLECPSLGSTDEIAAYDFAAAFGMSAKASDDLRAALLAASDLSKLADRLDADFGIACAEIALDLDQKGDYRTGRAACDAAVKGVEQARSKIGPKVGLHLVAPKALCQTDVNAVTKCANVCDSSALAKSTQTECSLSIGRCDAPCDGTCELGAPRTCDGSCAGACEGNAEGICGGRCKGKCDGKRSSGPCAGTCVGVCEGGPFEGTCAGKCRGTCAFRTPSACEGACAGSCAVPMAGAKCAGEFKAPAVRPSCHARCELAGLNVTECAKPTAALVVTGKVSHADKDHTARLMKAVEGSFPGLLQTLGTVGGSRGAERIASARDEIERMRSELRKTSRPASKGVTAPSCFDDVLKKAIEAAGNAKVEIEQAAALESAVAK